MGAFGATLSLHPDLRSCARLASCYSCPDVRSYRLILPLHLPSASSLLPIAVFPRVSVPIIWPSPHRVGFSRAVLIQSSDAPLFASGLRLGRAGIVWTDPRGAAAG
eukprot:953421-Rhodomonas_salina.1